MPYQLNEPALTDRLFRAYDLKGQLGDQINEQLQPVIVTDNLAAQPEYLWTRGRERRLSELLGLAASPGNFGVVVWTLNTSISPGARIGIVERVIIRNADAADGAFYIGSCTAAAVAGVTFTNTEQMQHDDRQGSFQVMSGFHLGGGTIAARPAGAQNGVLVGIKAGASYEWNGPFISTGLLMLCISTAIVNGILQVSVQWRERDTLPSEVR